MSNSVIGALRVNLSLDSAQFERGAKKSQNTLKTMRSQFVAVSAAAGAMAVALGGITMSSARAATEISRLAQVSNTAPVVLQKWAAGAKTVGIEQEKLSDILKDVNDRIGDFVTTGGGPMADFFEKVAPKIGITAEAFRNLSGAEGLQLFVSSLEKANLSQAEMTFYMEAMASDSTLLLPLLRDNANEMNRLGESAATLGAVMSNETVAALNDANIAVGQVSLAFEGMKNRIAAELAPALTVLANGFANSMREGGVLREVTDALITNLDRLGAYVAVAVAAFGVRYVGALVAAKLATATLSGALIFLRTALIRTGIGALIVGAGELVFWFGKLVTATGGFGAALGALKNVAIEVFERMGKGVDALRLTFRAAANGISEGFLNSFASIVDGFAKLTAGVAAGWNSLMTSIGLESKATAKGIGADFADSIRLAATDAGNISRVSSQMAGVYLREATAPLASLKALSSATDDLGDSASDTTESITNLNDAADGAGGGSGGGGLKGATENAKELTQELDGPLSSAVDGVANAFGDWIANGFRDFKSFTQSIVSSFKQMISQMISTAIANPIKLAISGGVGVAGTAAQAAPGALGGAGGMLGNIGALGGSLAAGAGNVLSATFGAGGSLGLGAASIGGQVGAAFAAPSIASVGAAIGAVAVPLLAVAGVFSFFKKSTKQLDAGLRVTVDGFETALDTFETIQTKRFWGLSKKTSTNFTGMDAAEAAPIQNTIRMIQMSVEQSAAALGVGADAFDGFTASISLSLKGLSAEEQTAKLGQAIRDVGNMYAEQIMGLTEFQLEGEDSVATLTRLTTAFATVQDTMRYFGRDLLDVNIHAAGVSAQLIEMSGGLQAFQDANSFYAQNFFSEAEQLAMNAGALGRAFASLNLQTPQSVMDFRALVEAQNIGTEAGRQMYAALMQLAPAFIAVQDATDAAADSAVDFAGAVSSAWSDLQASVAAAMRPLQEQLRVAQSAMSESESIVNSLRGALTRMRMESQRAGIRAAAQATLRGMLGGGRINDTKAFQDALSVVQEPSEALFATFVDYQRDFFRTAGVIRALESTAGKQLSADERIVLGLEDQIAQLDAILESFRIQIDATLSIVDAIKALESALLAQAGGVGGGAAAPNVSGFPDSVYSGWAAEQRYLANNPDVLAAVADGRFASAADHFQQFGQFEGRAFARGGMHAGGLRLVGEEGPELEVTGPSRIYSASQTRSMLSGGNNSASLSGADQRELLRLLRLIEKNTKDTTRGVEDLVDMNGAVA